MKFHLNSYRMKKFFYCTAIPGCIFWIVYLATHQRYLWMEWAAAICMALAFGVPSVAYAFRKEPSAK